MEESQSKLKFMELVNDHVHNMDLKCITQEAKDIRYTLNVETADMRTMTTSEALFLGSTAGHTHPIKKSAIMELKRNPMFNKS